jgi:hypothetical protein
MRTMSLVALLRWGDVALKMAAAPAWARSDPAAVERRLLVSC